MRRGPRNRLREGCLGFWKIEEAATVARADATQWGNNLTDTGSIAATGGIIGSAGQFGANKYLTLASGAANTYLSLGDTSFTVCASVYFDTLGAFRFIVTKDSGSNPNREYDLYYSSSAQKFAFDVFKSDGTVKTAQSAVPNPPVSGTWYHVIGWHDRFANTVNIVVDNGTVGSTSTSGFTLVGQTGARWDIGARNNASNMVGRIDNVGVWGRILTGYERARLYNAAAHREFPF